MLAKPLLAIFQGVLCCSALGSPVAPQALVLNCNLLPALFLTFFFKCKLRASR